MTPIDNSQRHRGGVIHTYQQYDPKSFPSPTAEQPDLVSPAFEHMLTYGSTREFTEEELANAIRLDPGQFAGLGPSLDALLKMLQERKEKILSKYETDTVQKKAARQFSDAAKQARPPAKLAKSFWQSVKEEQIYALENLWYRAERTDPDFAGRLVSLMESLGEKYQVDHLAAKYDFTGRDSMTVPEAIEILDELRKIDELLKQLENAKENAQLAIIDMEDLSEFADPEMMANLNKFQEQVQQYLKDIMEGQGLANQQGKIQLSPKAYKLFQGRLLQTIFSNLKASRAGRHQGPIEGEGVVEMQRTKPYEFGDSVSQMDIPSTLINAMLRQGDTRPLRLQQGDIEIHRSRNNPKCATVVVLDMSGSMRYDGQYINVKRMALALDGLIHSEYPGDFLGFVEMYTFAKIRRIADVIDLMPKPVTLFQPSVQLRVDMSRENVSEHMVHPHFTNMQHALRLSRQLLAGQNAANKQIIVITDGLPTAHFDNNDLYLLYPPHPATEQATMREALLCQREGITINLFLIPSWSQSEEDIRFAYRLAQSAKGRVIFTSGNDLDRFVIWDYVKHKREMIG